jgi:hypothetical protein
MGLGWPRERGKIIVVLDSDSPGDKKFANEIVKPLGPQYSVRFESLPPGVKNVSSPSRIFPGKMRTPGYDRQQWSNLISDKHTSAKVIGIIDADAIFTTDITPRSIVGENGKIIATGIRGGGCFTRPKVAKKVFGRPCAATFMGGNFPVFVRRETFGGLRKAISEAYGKDFNSAFGELASSGWYGQFDLLMNWAYFNQREMYEWHIQPRPADFPLISVPVMRNAIHGIFSGSAFHHVHKGCCYSTFHRHGSCSLLKGTMDLQSFRWRVESTWPNTISNLWNQNAESCRMTFWEHYENVRALNEWRKRQNITETCDRFFDLIERSGGKLSLFRFLSSKKNGPLP